MLCKWFQQTNKQIKHFLFLLFPEKNREIGTQESPWVNLGAFFCEGVEGQINLSFSHGQNIYNSTVIVKVIKGQRNMPFFSSFLKIPQKSLYRILLLFIMANRGQSADCIHMCMLHNIHKRECRLMLVANLCAQWWYETCCWCNLPHVHVPPQAG